MKAARATVRPDDADLALQKSRWSANWRRALDLTPLAKRTNLIRDHLTPGSVWFRNSVRGAVALAAAVGVEGALSLQHGFWVVLATLSVLRSNASGTGATATRAIAGTVVGFAIGGALMVGLGTAPEFLWAILPPVAFLAGFAGTISFAAAQAAFTVLVVVLFNIIEPEGWMVGLVRLEDIVIGCLVSVGVGVLFWPHGAAAALAERLAAAYRSAVAYLVVIVRGAAAYGGRTADEIAEHTAQAALGASRRLDEAFSQYLAERGARRFDMDDVAALLVGASRTRLIAYSLAESSDGSRMPPRGRRRCRHGRCSAGRRGQPHRHRPCRVPGVARPRSDHRPSLVWRAGGRAGRRWDRPPAACPGPGGALPRSRLGPAHGRRRSKGCATHADSAFIGHTWTTSLGWNVTSPPQPSE